MDLLTLIGTLETNLTREIIATNTGDELISYTNPTPFTTTINTSTEYSNTDRLCLTADSTATNLYISATYSSQLPSSA